MNLHEFYMRRCLELAQLGLGSVAPNPMVGAVIVLDDKVIGEGYHEIFGGPHAEVNAIGAVKDKSVLNNATIYVSLEPCSHHGKTPPCADLIIKHGFKKVVIGCQDTFSEVSGKGVQRLKDAGIEVEIGILEHEARNLNKRFFTFHEDHRPYIILKWAQSQNGYIDIQRSDNNTGIHWITQPETKKLVHKWRSEEMAILVGKNTVLNDNPSLTVRNWKGANPVRIVLDSNLEIPNNASILNDVAPTIVLNKIQNGADKTIQYIKLKDMQPKNILDSLYQLNIQSIIIEGGKTVLQAFINKDLWDEARILIGINPIDNGEKAPILERNSNNASIHCSKFGKDQIEIVRRS